MTETITPAQRAQSLQIECEHLHALISGAAAVLAEIGIAESWAAEDLLLMAASKADDAHASLVQLGEDLRAEENAHG